MFLTEKDRQLIDDAAQAFADDFRYLEAILWQAQNRKEPASESTRTAVVV